MFSWGGSIIKQRLISAGIGIILMAAVLSFSNTLVLNIVVSLISITIINELLTAVKCSKNIPLSVSALIFTAVIPFFKNEFFNTYGKMIIGVFVFVLFVIMIFQHKTLRIEQIGLVFFISTAIPLSLSSVIYIRDSHVEHGLFLILLSLGLAWLADAGGLAFGLLFGKHKLVPEISPKKTVEGLIGGFAANILFVIIMGAIYNHIMKDRFTVAFIPMIIISVVCTVLSVLGDLSASVIKRRCEIKDFGSIMPGHGGILDRFDSVLFVAPFVYYTLNFVDIIKAI